MSSLRGGSGRWNRAIGGRGEESDRWVCPISMAAYANSSPSSRCAIPSTISIVAMLTVHTSRSKSMTRSLWSENR